MKAVEWDDAELGRRLSRSSCAREDRIAAIRATIRSRREEFVGYSRRRLVNNPERRQQIAREAAQARWYGSCPVEPCQRCGGLVVANGMNPKGCQRWRCKACGKYRIDRSQGAAA